MRRIGLALLVGGTVALSAASALAASASMVDSEFDPTTITVRAGEAITFTNDGVLDHTATADDGSFDTGTVSAGDSATITINRAGRYAFYCAFHGAPGGVGMSGTIYVIATGGPAPPTASPLPWIAAGGAALLVAGLLLGRRARTT